MSICTIEKVFKKMKQPDSFIYWNTEFHKQENGSFFKLYSAENSCCEITVLCAFLFSMHIYRIHSGKTILFLN